MYRSKFDQQNQSAALVRSAFDLWIIFLGGCLRQVLEQLKAVAEELQHALEHWWGMPMSLVMLLHLCNLLHL